MRLSHDIPCRLARLLFTLLMVVAWADVGRVLAADAPARLPLTLPDLRNASDLAREPLGAATRPSGSLDDVTARANAISGWIDPSLYNPGRRAAKLGPGIEPAFACVRDEIRFESYRGAMRGATGTYAERAGNALDRSLLLAGLLRAKGFQVRFARGRLDADRTGKLWDRIFEPDRFTATGPTTAPAAREPADSLVGRLKARATRDYAVVRGALGDRVKFTSGPTRQQVLAEIADHTWVQAMVNGKWIDLDSSFADATVGKAYTQAAQTFDALPDEQFQQANLRVVVETLEGGALHKTTALESTFFAEDLLDQQIFLTHVPTQATDVQSALGSAVRDASGAPSWTPVLWIAGETRPGKPVVFNDQADKPAPRGRPPGGGLGGLFGRGGALAAPAPQFVAEWLEIEFVLPGGQRDLTRRVLCDRAGEAWRSASSLDASKLPSLPRDAEGLLAPRALHNIWFSAGRHDLAGYAQSLRLLCQLDRQMPSGPDPSDPFGLQAWPLAMQNFALLVLSDHVVVPSLNDRPDVRFYCDCPRVVVMTAGIEMKDGAEHVYLQHDLRRDRLRGLARDAAAESAVADRRIWFGLLEGALEHEMAVQDAYGTGLDASAVSSTSALNDGSGAVVLNRGAADRDLPTRPDPAARARRSLADGATLVIPRSALASDTTGWWEIASDGTTRAVFGADLNGAILGGGRYGYDKPHVPSRPGGGKTYQIPDPDEAPPRPPPGTGGSGPTDLDPPLPRPTDPQPDRGKKQGAAPEYFAVLKQISTQIIRVSVSTVFILAITLGPQLLANYICDALTAGVLADLNRGPPGA